MAVWGGGAVLDGEGEGGVGDGGSGDGEGGDEGEEEIAEEVAGHGGRGDRRDGIRDAGSGCGTQVRAGWVWFPLAIGGGWYREGG